MPRCADCGFLAVEYPLESEPIAVALLGIFGTLAGAVVGGLLSR